MPEIMEALYRFQPESQEDLELSPGQEVEVLEHLSADWARGKNLSTGKVGIFPKNYVKPVSERKGAFSRPAVSIPPNNTDSSSCLHPQRFDEKQQYQPPHSSWQPGPPQYLQQQYQPPQQYQQYQPPQQYQAPPQQYVQPPQPFQTPQQPPQQHGGGHGQLGNLARRFGDSVMFGAGATLGSDIINKIF